MPAPHAAVEDPTALAARGLPAAAPPEPSPATGGQGELPLLSATEFRQVQLGILVCYLVDALCLGGFALLGLVPVAVPVLLALLGLALAGGALWMLPRLERLQRHAANVVVAQTSVAIAAVLAIAWMAPAVAPLMLFTVIVIFATAALRMAPRMLLLTGLATGFGSVLVASMLGDRMRLPVATAPERLASGVFFVWTLFKGASVNLIGTQWRRQILQGQQQLAQALARVEQLATHDELTGLPNRRHILERLEQELHRSRRSGEAFGLMMIDLDHFKRINDSHGHAAGDAVLKCFAETARGTLRQHDLVGRLGGEEFLLVLAGPVDDQGLRTIARRLQHKLGEQPWAAIAPGLAPTISMGATLNRPGEPAEAMLDRADRLLYRAKQAGRDRLEQG